MTNMSEGTPAQSVDQENIPGFSMVLTAHVADGNHANALAVEEDVMRPTLDLERIGRSRGYGITEDGAGNYTVELTDFKATFKLGRRKELGGYWLDAGMSTEVEFTHSKVAEPFRVPVPTNHIFKLLQTLNYSSEVDIGGLDVQEFFAHLARISYVRKIWTEAIPVSSPLRFLHLWIGKSTPEADITQVEGMFLQTNGVDLTGNAVEVRVPDGYKEKVLVAPMAKGYFPIDLNPFDASDKGRWEQSPYAWVTYRLSNALNLASFYYPQFGPHSGYAKLLINSAPFHERSVHFANTGFIPPILVVT